MRIAICGTLNIGKSTCISDFISKYPKFNYDKNSYRQTLQAKNLPHNKKTNKKTQWLILNNMLDNLKLYKYEDNIIFDRSPIDNLVYSLRSYNKGASDIDNSFIQDCLPLIKESMSYLDIIIFLPLNKNYSINIVNNGIRETDKTYIEEIDNIFGTITNEYSDLFTNKHFFEIYGTRQEKEKK